MSYYDPKVYNDDALNEDEKKLIAMYDFAIDDAGNKEFIIDDLMGLYSDENEDTLIKIQREIASKTIDAVIQYLQSQRMEFIVSWLDSRPEEE